MIKLIRKINKVKEYFHWNKDEIIEMLKEDEKCYWEKAYIEIEFEQNKFIKNLNSKEQTKCHS